ncbi:MAG: hypothetical protein ACREXN_06765 [Polaromonas sp.]
MNIRLFSSPLAGVALAALLFIPLWASVATAQVNTPQTPSAPPAFRSALEGYKPYTDEKTVNWKEANDTTARIGGWRAYAKEASQPESGATPATDAATPPDPHAGHAKP